MAKLYSNAEKDEIDAQFHSGPTFHLTIWRKPSGKKSYTLGKSWRDKYGKWEERSMAGALFELYFISDLMQQFQNSQRVKK